MEVFYRKHHATNYCFAFNWLVYAAIWCRAGLFIMLSAGQNLLDGKKAFPAPKVTEASPQPEAKSNTDACGFTGKQSSEAAENKPGKK